jgi:hypothetical protein
MTPEMSFDIRESEYTWLNEVILVGRHYPKKTQER